MPGDFLNPEERIDLSPEIGNETKTTTCYMCACRCGIKVHLRDGQIRLSKATRIIRSTRAYYAARDPLGSCSIIRRRA